MDKNRQKLLKKLDRIEWLDKGPKLFRFLNSPARYLDAQKFRRFTYPKEGKGRLEKVKTFFGSNMQLLLPAGTDIFLLGAKTHDSEIRLSRFFVKNINPGDIFVDAGAHFGFYSLLAAHLMNNEGIILSADASKTMFEVLGKNIEGQTAVRAIHRALTANDTDSIEFTEFPILYSEYNTLHAEQFENADWYKNIKPEKITVQGSRIDTLLPFFMLMAKGLSPNARYFVKIDVEGAEYEVIQGFTKFLDNTELKGRIFVVVEYWAGENKQAQHDDAVNFLKEKGFEACVIDKKGDLKPIKDLNTLTESENLVFR